MQTTFTRRIKYTKAQVADGKMTFDRVREYVTDAYGLSDTDELHVKINRTDRIATVTFTVDGPRAGRKWAIR